jgi:hypothetical protein
VIASSRTDRVRELSYVESVPIAAPRGPGVPVVAVVMKGPARRHTAAAVLGVESATHD